MHPSRFRKLLLLLRFEIDALEQRLDELASRDYPSEVGGEYIDFLRSQLQAQAQLVSSIALDFANDPKGAYQRLQSEHRKLYANVERFDWLDNAQTRKVPWSLVPTIERLFASLAPSRRLLVSCSNEFNYEIRFRERPSGAGSNFVFLKLPTVHRLNPLLHVLIAHELFHPIVGAYLDTQQVEVLKRIAARLQELDKGAGEQILKGDAKRLDQLVEEIRTIWRRGMEELMCDLGCGAWFGPAALFASMVFSMPLGADSPPSDPSFYPPWRYRLRVLYRYTIGSEQGVKSLGDLDASLSAGGEPLAPFRQALSEELEDIRKYVSDEADKKAIAGSALAEFAYEEVERTLDGAWVHVLTHIPNTGDSWGEHVGQIPKHLFRLVDLVPPCEWWNGHGQSEPSSYSAVANAAWLVELAQAADTPDLRQYHRSCRLMFKAVEGSEFLRRYANPQAREGA